MAHCNISYCTHSLFFSCFTFNLPAERTRISIPHLFIYPFLRGKFFMPSALYCPSIFQYDDPVGRYNGRKAVGYDDDRLIP